MKVLHMLLLPAGMLLLFCPKYPFFFWAAGVLKTTQRNYAGLKSCVVTTCMWTGPCTSSLELVVGQAGIMRSPGGDFSHPGGKELPHSLSFSML